ncbi:unnamed protein product [Ceratitis capitata]|uniref:(Mediterranean fruit fly) hypothetical protein n=1 Tax=Ceratitis capitata TaxID=7213 RepID=W8BKQ8_CERCA|nr:unnamed protein product [Ceratitis capitata]
MVVGNGNEGLVEEERYPCPICGKSYLRKRHLQRHMRDECIDIPPRFSCDLCPSRFRRKYHMVRHLTSKHGIPTAVANQATSNGGRAKGYRSSGGSSVRGINNARGCDGSVPENLSLKKNRRESDNKRVSSHEPPTQISGGGVVNGTCAFNLENSMADQRPTYGLTGAITAISTAAAIGHTIANGPGSVNEEIPHSLGSGNVDIASGSGQGAANVPINTIGDDWKMKLGIQLISNSLLKERLNNAMPFTYNN